jgi:hypothetical protein
VNRYRAYGLEIASQRALPLRASSSRQEPDLRILYSAPTAPLVPSGPDRRALVRGEAGWSLRYDNEKGGWLAFDYAARERTLRVSGSVPWEEWEGPLSGVVCGVLLRLGGATLLHAACLDVGGGAIAILGASGDGKSTLAGALVSGGAVLLSEDLLAVGVGPAGYLAEPGAPSLHLLPDAHRSLGLPYDAALIRGDGKIRLTLPSAGTEAVPLSAIFILRRGGDCAQPSLERLSGAAAVAGLAEHLYGSSWIRPPDTADLLFCARLKREVPVFAVSRPWSLDELAETADLLTRCAAQCREARNFATQVLEREES